MKSVISMAKHQLSAELLRQKDMSVRSHGRDALYFYIKRFKMRSDKLRGPCVRHLVAMGCNPDLLMMCVKVRDAAAFEVLYPLVGGNLEELYLMSIKAGTKMVPEPPRITAEMVEAAYKGMNFWKLADLIKKCDNIEKNYILHFAATHYLATPDIIKNCLEKGFNIDEKNSAGQTAMDIAVAHKNIRTIECLAYNRADISAHLEVLSDIVKHFPLYATKSMQRKLNVFIEKTRLDMSVQKTDKKKSNKL